MTDRELVDRLVAAWSNPGKYPGWHFKMQAELKKRWPVLARIIEDAVRSRGEQQVSRRKSA